MVKKPNIQKVILKALGEKPAVALDSFKEKSDPKVNYSLARSIKNLVESGYAEVHDSDNQKYVKITKKGKTKLNSIRLEGGDALVSATWDGLWRIIILDIAEDSNLSNIWSQFLDTVIFMFIAFLGIYSVPTIISIIIPWWLFKVLMGFFYTPLSYLGIYLLKDKNANQNLQN